MVNARNDATVVGLVTANNPMAKECAFFGHDASFHHIGLAVESIRAVDPSCQIYVEKTQRVSLTFVSVNGIRIELLEPLGDNSPIASSLGKGMKLLHLCYEVPNIEAALATCKPFGFHPISRPLPAPLYGNRRVIWVYSSNYGLFELIETDGAPVSSHHVS